MDFAALDTWITGDSNGAYDEYEDAPDTLLIREAEDAANSDDPGAMVAWIVANCPPNDPALPIWRAEVARRNTLTIGV
jgi:hypothetical protein